MLERTVRRALAARTVDVVAVATTVEDRDDAIVRECQELAVPCFRGSEGDVLQRYCEAAGQLNTDVVVRITSDCPLIDPVVVDLVVSSYLAAKPPVDYASNTLTRTYPRGLDVEVF